MGAARAASARTCWASTRSCPATPRGPRRWPGRWSRSATGSSPCWPARTGWSTAGTGWAAGLAAWSVSLSPRRVIHGAFTRDGGYQAMSSILAAGGARPDCVFAVNDVMAVGALARLRADGLAVPGGLAVAGFDDITTLRDIYPPLT